LIAEDPDQLLLAWARLSKITVPITVNELHVVDGVNTVYLKAFIVPPEFTVIVLAVSVFAFGSKESKPPELTVTVDDVRPNLPAWKLPLTVTELQLMAEAPDQILVGWLRLSKITVPATDNEVQLADGML